MQAYILGIILLAVSSGPAQSDPCLALSITRNADSNGLSLRFGGESGVLYIVEASADLQNWNPVWTNAGPALDSAIQFTNTIDQLFYRVSRGPLPNFTGAMTSKTTLSLTGNNLYVDSFDSGDPLYSTNGLYDFSSRKAGGDLNLGGNFDAQNCVVKGKVHVSPPGSVLIGPGSIGDLDWNNPGIEPGWYQNDFAFCLPDVIAPYSSGFPPVKQPSGTNTYILNNGAYYVAGDFALNANQTLFVAGNSRLYVTGNFIMQSPTSSYLTIGPNASLKLYVGSASGAGVNTTISHFSNPTNALNFQYFGLPSNTNVTFTTATQSAGCVYAPGAKLTLATGGAATNDFLGTLVGKSILLNGYYQFHFDENLLRAGPTR